MPTTTNYGWTTPADTDLVKDGAAAIRTLGSGVDTTVKNLNPETTFGDISYRSSTANVKTRLGIGTTGQVLTVSGGVPAWAAPVSGGGYTLLSTTTLSGSETSVTSISGSYQDLFIEVYGVTFSTSDATPYLYFNTNSSNSYYKGFELGEGGLEHVDGFVLNNNADQWLRTDSNNYVSCLVNNYANTVTYKTVWCSVGYKKGGSANAQVGINKTYYDTNAITSVQFGLGGGRTFSSGTIKIWGVK